MEICNHFIQKNQIIGIGPLIVKLSSNIAIQEGYNSRQLFFHVHLKNHFVLIESDWFDLEPSIDRDKKNKGQLEAFKKAYG